jgi:hypothetical protein
MGVFDDLFKVFLLGLPALRASFGFSKVMENLKFND